MCDVSTKTSPKNAARGDKRGVIVEINGGAKMSFALPGRFADDVGNDAGITVIENRCASADGSVSPLRPTAEEAGTTMSSANLTTAGFAAWVSSGWPSLKNGGTIVAILVRLFEAWDIVTGVVMALARLPETGLLQIGDDG